MKILLIVSLISYITAVWFMAVSFQGRIRYDDGFKFVAPWKIKDYYNKSGYRHYILSVTLIAVGSLSSYTYYFFV